MRRPALRREVERVHPGAFAWPVVIPDARGRLCEAWVIQVGRTPGQRLYLGAGATETAAWRNAHHRVAEGFDPLPDTAQPRGMV